jgi:hypothetical protein
MEILKHGKNARPRKLQGYCKDCGCVVLVSRSETQELIDRDTTAGSATRYIPCPECNNEFLWVKQ